MILNFHSLACLIFSPLVSARTHCVEQSCSLRPWSHAAEPITFPITRRQWIPPRNSTESTSLTSTIWTTKPIAVDLSHTTNGPVPAQTSTYPSFSTTEVLEPSGQYITVTPGEYFHAAQSTEPRLQTVPEAYRKASSAAIGAHLSPLSYGQNVVPSTTATFHTSQTTGFPVQHQSSRLVVVPFMTSAGDRTWLGSSATLSSLSNTKVGSLHADPSTSASSVGGPSAVGNNTNSLDTSSPTIIQLVPASQHHHTSGISQASQPEATSLSSAFNLGISLNQTGESSIFQGWNRTTSSTGALVTTRVISKSVSGTSHPVSLNNTSYKPGPSTSSSHSSQSDSPNFQSMAIVTTGLSSQNSESLATISAAQSQNNERITTTHTTTLLATQSATESAAGAPGVPPPLTTSQTAGVAIASTTGLLIAIVAVLYVVRRHRAKDARRSSTGSIYPKVAYLYDPPPDDQPEKAYRNPTMMSGGIYTRSPSKGNNRQRMHGSPYQREHSYGGSLPPYTYEAAGEGQNAIAQPCSLSIERNSYAHTLAQSTDHRSANIDRNIASPPGSPTQHAEWQPLPPRSRPLRRSASAAQYSILSDISSAACSPQENLDNGKYRRISTLRSSCSFPSTPRIAEATYHQTRSCIAEAEKDARHVQSASYSQEDTSNQSR